MTEPPLWLGILVLWLMQSEPRTEAGAIAAPSRVHAAHGAPPHNPRVKMPPVLLAWTGDE
jgi:hypothetical protein